MVTPVTATSVLVGGTGDPLAYRRVNGFKQEKPIDRVLPYDACRGNLTYTVGLPGSGGARSFAGFNMIDQVDSWDPWYHLENRAYEKFINELHASASLGAAVAEAASSYSMIATRASQLWKFTRDVRRGDLDSAARTLNLSAVPKRASKKKAWSGNWLEFNLGWSPMIGDIGNAIDVLQNDFGYENPRARVGEVQKTYHLSPPTQGSNPAAVYPGFNTWHTYRYWLGRRSVACGARVAVANPNLLLANQLGFVNPAAVAWELVPMSFVVDWFVNIGDVLNSFSDFLGLTLSREWTTRRYKGVSLDYYHATYRWWENGKYVSGGGTIKNLGGPFVHVNRRLGLPSPVLAIRPLKVPHWRRALTAVSLLIVKGFKD